MDKNDNSRSIQKYIERCNSFLTKFVYRGPIHGLTLRSNDQDEFQGLIIDVNKLLKERFGEHSIYSFNIFNFINAPNMDEGPSYTSIQNVISVLQNAERKKQPNYLSLASERLN